MSVADLAIIALIVLTLILVICDSVRCIFDVWCHYDRLISIQMLQYIKSSKLASEQEL